MHLYNGVLVYAGYEERLEKLNKKDELDSFLIELGYSKNQSSKILNDDTLYTFVDLLDRYHHLTLEKSAGEGAKNYCKKMNMSKNPSKD